MSIGFTNKKTNKTLLHTLNRFFETAEEQCSGMEFYQNLIQQSFEPILKQLGFLHDPNIRTSLFLHTDEGFILQYRHSDDPEFDKKSRNRTIYPISEGIIGETYRKNKCLIKNLPDPQKNEDEWIKAQMNDKIGKMKTKNAVKNLTMQSRNILGLPIRCGHKKHMIIVFESLTPDQIKEKNISKILKSEHGIILKEVLSMYRDLIGPAPEYARQVRM